MLSITPGVTHFNKSCDNSVMKAIFMYNGGDIITANAGSQPSVTVQVQDKKLLECYEGKSLGTVDLSHTCMLEIHLQMPTL